MASKVEPMPLKLVARERTIAAAAAGGSGGGRGGGTGGLIMTEQLRQAIRLLQLSRLELIEEIRAELDANPVLENDAPESDADTTTTEPT